MKHLDVKQTYSVFLQSVLLLLNNLGLLHLGAFAYGFNKKYHSKKKLD